MSLSVCLSPLSVFSLYPSHIYLYFISLRSLSFSFYVYMQIFLSPRIAIFFFLPLSSLSSFAVLSFSLFTKAVEVADGLTKAAQAGLACRRKNFYRPISLPLPASSSRRGHQSAWDGPAPPSSSTPSPPIWPHTLTIPPPIPSLTSSISLWAPYLLLTGGITHFTLTATAAWSA